MPIIKGEKSLSPHRHWWPAIVTFVVLLGVALFVWRIFYYFDLIKSGQIAENRIEQARDMTVSELTAAAASTSNKIANFSLAEEPAFGNPGAALKIVMFGDFACPYSQQLAFTLRSLTTQFSDKVYFVYKDFPLADLHPEAILAAEAAGCAQDQGKFWEMFDKLYQNQSDLSQTAIVEYARALDLEMGKFISCLNSGVKASLVEADLAEGLQAGVYGTPTMFLGDQMIEGAVPADLLRGVMEKMTE
ncbi:MAG: thioredoxin domain-containing protein [Patescibacteria group bacterium]|jgi:protein-disulfide isomerase